MIAHTARDGCESNVTTGRCCTIQSVRLENDTNPDRAGDKPCSAQLSLHGDK